MYPFAPKPDTVDGRGVRTAKIALDHTDLENVPASVLALLSSLLVQSGDLCRPGDIEHEEQHADFSKVRSKPGAQAGDRVVVHSISPEIPAADQAVMSNEGFLFSLPDMEDLDPGLGGLVCLPHACSSKNGYGHAYATLRDLAITDSILGVWVGDWQESMSPGPGEKYMPRGEQTLIDYYEVDSL